MLWKKGRRSDNVEDVRDQSTGRALRIGRAGMAGLGGAGQFAYVGAMDAVDMEVDASTYILAGALGAGDRLRRRGQGLRSVPASGRHDR